MHQFCIFVLKRMGLTILMFEGMLWLCELQAPLSTILTLMHACCFVKKLRLYIILGPTAQKDAGVYPQSDTQSIVSKIGYTRPSKRFSKRSIARVAIVYQRWDVCRVTIAAALCRCTI